MELCLTTSGYGEILKKGITEPIEGDKGKADEQQVAKNRLLNEKRKANHFQRGQNFRGRWKNPQPDSGHGTRDEKFHSTVKLGDNSKLEVLGKGKVAVRLKDGSLNYITDVFYAPGICQNLLSVRQLAEKGYDLKFNKGGCTI
ncbi:hypothetical protein KIW84_013034 [Lathyrus oleraceus]|uniref:Retrovirus-related Pol polyprotein from transposon TNT 1-94-like beta-barrel domain-containing protein n=1 Tax=Pisum sativum TaxID=3888 RepID=A0A9D5BJ25_PEA|nr:hypothetical protein KIW84_013034 [Pisum sativum]